MITLALTTPRSLPSDKPPVQPVIVRAVELLGPTRQVVIEHRGERYVLRLTRGDKLLLTK